MKDSDKTGLARTAGLAQLRTPRLEDVDRRRSQLWILSLLVGLVVPIAMVTLGPALRGEWLEGMLAVGQVRLILLALLVAMMGYVAEREHALRGLSSLLVEERVLTATLVARVDELDHLLHASKAMNSTLEASTVLAVILRSASELLKAAAGSIQLVDLDDGQVLEVAAVEGTTTARIGQRQAVGDGLAGSAAEQRDALLVDGHHDATRSDLAVGSALVVPLEHRGVLVGILNLAAEDGVHFTGFQLRSVAVFAETAAAAIANARTHESSQARVEALTQLDRMKSEFLALVTHELRTPIASLIGLSATVADNVDRLPPDRIARLAGMARDEGWRLERLVSDLLASSAAAAGALTLSPAPADLGELLADMVTALDAGTPDHDVVLVHPTQPIVRGVDVDAVARIVTNLVGNAAKYSPAHTRVTVRVSPEQHGATISVTDEGPGIPAQERADLFSKFRRGSGVSGTSGLGLGLYIVQSLARAHGGDAAVGPGAEGGSEFRVTLADLSMDERVPAPA